MAEVSIIIAKLQRVQAFGIFAEIVVGQFRIGPNLDTVLNSKTVSDLKLIKTNAPFIPQKVSHSTIYQIIMRQGNAPSVNRKLLLDFPFGVTYESILCDSNIH